MYRNKLDEIRQAKRITNKQWSDRSGISVDTISRIIHPQNPDKDSPKVNTMEDLCHALDVELWEIFYNGNESPEELKAENEALKQQNHALFEQNQQLKSQLDGLRDKIDALKDDLIYYMKKAAKLYGNSQKDKSRELVHPSVCRHGRKRQKATKAVLRRNQA